MEEPWLRCPDRQLLVANMDFYGPAGEDAFGAGQEAFRKCRGASLDDAHIIGDGKSPTVHGAGVPQFPYKNCAHDLRQLVLSDPRVADLLAAEPCSVDVLCVINAPPTVASFMCYLTKAVPILVYREDDGRWRVFDARGSTAIFRQSMGHISSDLVLGSDLNMQLARLDDQMLGKIHKRIELNHAANGYSLYQRNRKRGLLLFATMDRGIGISTGTLSAIISELSASDYSIEVGYRLAARDDNAPSMIDEECLVGDDIDQSVDYALGGNAAAIQLKRVIEDAVDILYKRHFADTDGPHLSYQAIVMIAWGPPYLAGLISHCVAKYKEIHFVVGHQSGYSYLFHRLAPLKSEPTPFSQAAPIPMAMADVVAL